ncbi:MAG: dockerin type I domain-containing protein [Candidatus Poribacteria bacterium]|nr:dockerin type I domain-containing protein [Candidatus Poribacteria bacterium]
MKIAMVSLLVLMLFPYNIRAYDSPQWHLPDGAKARIGKGWIRDVAYSPDGARFAIAGPIGIWIYDLETLEEIDLIDGDRSPVEAVSFSRHGDLLAGGGNWIDTTVRLWDANTGEPLFTLWGYSYPGGDVAFSWDGKTLATGAGDSVKLWNSRTGTRKHLLEGHTHYVTSVAFSRDGLTLASGSIDNTVRIWNPDTRELQHTLELHTNQVHSVAISPDGKMLASGSEDGTVRLWNLRTGTLRRTLGRPWGGVYQVNFSPDGRLLCATTRRTVRLWNVETEELLHTFARPSAVGAVFSPDGETLAGASSGDVYFWDVNTGDRKHILNGHTGNGKSLAFSPDARMLANLRRDQSVQLLDVDTGELLHTFPGRFGAARGVAFSGDSRMLAGASQESVNLWDTQTGVHQRTLVGHEDNVTAVAFSLDNRMVASGSMDTTVRLWHAGTGGLKNTLHGHMYKVMSVAFSPDGSRVASASFKEVRIWDTATGKHLRTITWKTGWVESIVFSPNGRTLACASGGSPVNLWNVETGTLERSIISKGGCSSVDFSHAGRLLVGGSWDKTVRLWDTNSGEELRTFIGHAEEVTRVAFSPDGRTIASGSWDGTVLLWDLAPPPTVDSTVSITPALAISPSVGEQLTLSLDIVSGSDVVGYQASVSFDSAALRYVEAAAGDYLPADAFFVPPVIDANRVTLGGTAVHDASEGDGTLATLVFEVLEPKQSFLTLLEVSLVNSDGERLLPRIEHGRIVEPAPLVGDVNGDGEVNILDLVQVAANFTKKGENDADVNGDGVVDIIDLVTVAKTIGGGAAPSAYSPDLSIIGVADVERWLDQARGVGVGDANFRLGIRFLEGLLAALTPKETMMLPNYPNPFNPETWIPYRLAHGAEVNITIYDAKGTLVRRLALGFQSPGYYEDRGRAAYWDGRNSVGEVVASGVYFYRLRAGDFAASRRMAIIK